LGACCISTNIPRMIQFTIPGFKSLNIQHIVFDFNGTLGLDGLLLPGIEDKLNLLAKSVTLHIVTADTHGTVCQQLNNVNCEIVVIGSHNQDLLKADYLKNLGSESSIAIGNGRNDKLMLKKAAVGIVVMGYEGAAVEAIMAADVAVKDINQALELILNPKRLVATLRM
jgi:soluble P-type ATPase